MPCSKRPKFDHCTHAVSLPQSHSTGGSHRDLPSQGHPLALWLRCSPQSILLPAEKNLLRFRSTPAARLLFPMPENPGVPLLGESIPSLRSAFLPGNPDPQPRSLRAAERMDVLAGCIPPTSCPGFWEGTGSVHQGRACVGAGVVVPAVWLLWSAQQY